MATTTAPTTGQVWPIGVPPLTSGANVLVLGPTDPIPGGTVTGTTIVRTTGTTAVGTPIRQILMGYIAATSVNITVAWTATDCGTLASPVSSPGTTLLTISGGNIVVGTGVTMVMVSATTTVGAAVSGDKTFSVRKNGAAVVPNPKPYFSGSSGYEPMTIPPYPLAVTAGDTLDLGITNANTGSIAILETFLIVEVLA